MKEEDKKKHLDNAKKASSEEVAKKILLAIINKGKKK